MQISLSRIIQVCPSCFWSHGQVTTYWCTMKVTALEFHHTSAQKLSMAPHEIAFFVSKDWSAFNRSAIRIENARRLLHLTSVRPSFFLFFWEMMPTAAALQPYVSVSLDGHRTVTPPRARKPALKVRENSAPFGAKPKSVKITILKREKVAFVVFWAKVAYNLRQKVRLSGRNCTQVRWLLAAPSVSE